MADVLYLIRHSAPPDHARGRLWGRADPGVDPACMVRVATLAGLFWEKPSMLLSSPLARARATADIFSEAWGIPAQTEDDLAEIDYGAFDGLSREEIHARFPDAYDRWRREGTGYSFPDGETIADFYQRVESMWARCLELPAKAVACVTHGGIISAWCCLFLGMDLNERRVFQAEYSAATAFLRKRNGSGWELVYFNNKQET